MFERAAPGWKLRLFAPVLAVSSGAVAIASPAMAETPEFRRAVVEAAAGDEILSAHYRETDFESLWTGRDDAGRLRAFSRALAAASDHALPDEIYNPERVRRLLARATTHAERGAAEVTLTRLYLNFARDIQTGIVERPNRVDSGIARRAPRRDPAGLLSAIANNRPKTVFDWLAPTSPEYSALMTERRRLEQLIARGGWGAVVPGDTTMREGDAGNRVIALRDRLVRMGYLTDDSPDRYDTVMLEAIRRFQADHGLQVDGITGPITLGEVNKSAMDRLQSVIVAMERERWLPRDRGSRHVLVNLTDFTAGIVDDGKITFQTRAVVGANRKGHRSPEFSDEMEYMVLNPSWNVPYSIATKEYLPMLQEDPNAAGHLNLINKAGQAVSRVGIDFTRFDVTNFPFAMREPPGRGNALGLVKFMFPNRHNIYLHDTPEDHLFGRGYRAFSHGCIRLNDPFGFAHELLARQVTDPESYVRDRLVTGKERVISLETHVPVHLIYRTAFAAPDGRIVHRRDIYGRDAKIWRALNDAGVVLPAVRG